ncbi:biotin--acetyl-CoA-carboxylase ligase [Fibrobacter sp. UWB4]|uniref:biotin--[acetyl-CoA-carboxylase] ligase n=1 Tax=Fibrobacter sp. UWB4 TaxID=1964356 RepID=UPI000B5256CE|nr:biotin--[acetyl-CoA-carboxylase] ligase [Fibrobacter sp. UWB4]OWV15767.1 biotin--acetyl-CoA-carboxylase ligase [Fibrobacter sp. UWB4]
MFSQERNFTDWQLTGFGDAPAFLFETVGSTHKLMKSMAAAGEIAPGTLFVADSQSDGHGRHERTWDSPAGKNLYFNILIPLDGIPASNFAQITQVAALTFAETFNNVRECAKDSQAGPANRDCAESENANSPKITVKWPNDILYGKSKFCGILAEIVFVKREVPASAGMTMQQDAPRPALSMGVGINVNSDPAEYAHLNRAVTTLKEIFGHSINREKLLQALIGNLERAIGQFRAFGISPWISAWRKMDQFIGARGTIVVNNHCTDQNRDSGEGAIKKTGRIIDMNNDGSLLFECDDGTVETVISADLEI